MVQVYADGVLIYEPDMEGYELLGLEATVSTEAGGTATIVMPPDHPAYNAFVGFKTIVEIYRNEELIFRGRALYPTDDWDIRRTITCEGELCFLRDAVIEPYRYQTSPTIIFTDVINKYNAQVEERKQFRVGTVTAKDPNDYQWIESEDASQATDVIKKLLDYVGGHIVFTTASDGQRVINWLEELENTSEQVIEFGENLLDYTRSDANADLATVIYPYGAKDEETGVRVDITSVNNGKPYIEDIEAVLLRGRIAKPVFWDDVTIPQNLLNKARKYLQTSRMIVSTLTLSAVDLSAIDKAIDSFRVGDNVRVLSLPHGVDDVFALKERTYNLLDPAQDTITLGKETLMLTRADTAGDADAIVRIEKAAQNITTNYKVYVNNAVANIPGVSDIEELTERVAVVESDITAQNGEIASKVSRTEYEVALGTKADADDLEKVGTRVEAAESKIEQHADLIASKVSEETFNKLGTRVEAAESKIEQHADQIASKVSQTTFDASMGSKADKSELLNTFIQLAQPKAEHVGDVWVETDPQTWTQLKTRTWQSLKSDTWDRAMGYPYPKTYVWNGSRWVLESDMRQTNTAVGYITRIEECESSIVQQADQIESKVSKTAYEMDTSTLKSRITTAETTITQHADMIEDKVSKTITDPETGEEYNVEATVIETAETVVHEFNKIGLNGKQTGVTKVDETGIEVTHSNIGGKTTVNADGFRLYDANGNVIGGLMNVNGEVVSAVQRLANLLDTTFHLKVSPNIYGDGENGVEFIIDGENCGAITAQYLDGDIMGMRIRSNGNITFSDENGMVRLSNLYGKGKNVHFGKEEPFDAEDGDIWLCPVEV